LHIGRVVGPVVFKVREQNALAQKDAVVADVTVGDGPQHRGPHCAMVPDVLRLVFRATLNALSVTLHEHSL
jgi:hypothetical protein